MDRLYVVTNIDKVNNSYIYDTKEKAWSRFYTEVSWMINEHGTSFTTKEDYSQKCYEWSDGAKLILGFGYIDA